MYRLAAHCREWDVFSLIRQISPEQLDEWIAVDEIEPLGLSRLYEMIGLHGSHLATAHGWDIPPARFHPRPLGEADDEPMSNDEFAAAFSRLSH